MIAELFMNNAFNLTVILSCCAALVLMSVWYHRGEHRCKGFIFHAAQFFIYAIIIGTLGSIANNVIESYSLKFISPSVVDFICTSLIALILTIKLFLVINQFEKTQINKGNKPDSQRRTEQTQGNDGDKRPAILAPDKQQKFHNSQSGQQNSQQFKLLAHDIKNNSYFCLLNPAWRNVRLKRYSPVRGCTPGFRG